MYKKFENVGKCCCCHHPVKGIIQNHLWDRKHCKVIFSSALSYLIFWNYEIYSSEMVKNSILQRWRKHRDLLFWIDLKSMFKLPIFIHSWSFGISLPIFFNPSFQFLWEFVKIRKYSQDKYSKIPIIHPISHLFQGLGKIGKSSFLQHSNISNFRLFVNWENMSVYTT